MNTRARRTRSFNPLEINRNVKDNNQECGSDKEGKHGGKEDGSFGKDSDRDRSSLAEKNLDDDECDDESAEAAKETNDGGGIPSVLSASPLQGKEQTDDAWDE